MSTLLLEERRGAVVVLTMNRPQARNAITPELALAIENAVDRLDEDPSVAVGILTGAGATFCSGMDLKAFARGEIEMPSRGFGGMTQRPPATPMIAAVEGWALAGGCELALACDMVVAAEDAQFGIPEVKRGLVAAAGGLSRLPRALPHPVAMELALTGEPLGASRAHEYGLVNRLTPSGGALVEALSLAQQVAANGPLAVRASKWLMTTSTGWDDPTLWERQAERVSQVLASDDALEGARAFAEKREPRWSGH